MFTSTFIYIFVVEIKASLGSWLYTKVNSSISSVPKRKPAILSAQVHVRYILLMIAIDCEWQRNIFVEHAQVRKILKQIVPFYDKMM